MMNDKTPIRIGIVGTNFVSDWLADAAETLDYVNVTAVYSRKSELCACGTGNSCTECRQACSV